jgi:hypothetical protein
VEQAENLNEERKVSEPEEEIPTDVWNDPAKPPDAVAHPNPTPEQAEVYDEPIPDTPPPEE